MAPQVPYGHPTSLRAGDVWEWRISFADYPVSEGYALSYALVPTSSSTQAPLTWSADYVSDDGAEYTVSIPTSITDDFGKGGYRLTAFVTLSGKRYSPYSAPLLIAANSAALTTGGGLTHAETVWGYIKDVISGRATADVESYQINGRALNRTPMADLLKLENRYRTRVYRERNPGKGLPPVYVKFGG